MEENAKLTLSDKELELVSNTDWIFMKQAIVQKVFRMYGNLSETLQNDPALKILTAEKNSNGPKIARGEQYKGLPYVMLDYPRIFEKENIFALRSFFWWGHHFSIHLHLAGHFKHQYTPAIRNKYALLVKEGFSICVNDDPWEHHFEKNNYCPVEAISSKEFENLLEEKPFIKLAKKIHIHHWAMVNTFYKEAYHFLQQLLINYPGGGKDLSPDTPITDSGL